MKLRSYFISLSIIAMLSASALISNAALEVRFDDFTDEYTFVQDGRPVLTYKYGTVPTPPELKGKKYALPRSGYIHPIYGPDGEPLTKDYSPDHPHHRGIYWAWPEVSYKGRTHDLHALQGVFSRPVKILRTKNGADSAIIEVENVWMWEDRTPIVRELVEIRVHRSQDGLQPIDVELEFKALEPGVQIARRGKNQYGGLNVRLSSRSGQMIHKEIGDRDPYPFAVAELTGIPPNAQKPVGLLMLQSPLNPQYPCEWIAYPDINWLQPTFPRKGETYPLSTEEPLVLNYRFVVRSGPGLEKSRSDIFSAYLQDLIGPIWDHSKLEMGDDRSALRSFQDEIRALGKEKHAAIEAKLLLLLQYAAPSTAFKAWTCEQLAAVGSSKSVPFLVEILSGEAWMDAADALLSIPKESATRALAASIPTLNPEKQMSLIAVLAAHSGDAALARLQLATRSSEAGVRQAAIAALGSIATPKSSQFLLAMAAEPMDMPTLRDARLRSGRNLLRLEERRDLACELLLSVWKDEEAAPQHLAAALQGLAAAGYEHVLPLVQTALQGDNEPLYKAGLTALGSLPVEDLKALEPLYSSFTPHVWQALLRAWAARQMRSAEEYVMAALKGNDPVLQSAAIEAAVDMELSSAVDKLFELSLGNDEISREALNALKMITGQTVDEQIKSIALQAQGARSVLAIDILNARLGSESIDVMIELISSNDKNVVRKAFAVIRNHGTADHLPTLRNMLLNSDADRKRDLAKAVVGICLRLENPQRALGSFLSASPQLGPEERAALLNYVHAVGGDAALNFVLAETDEETVRALLKWPDSNAAEPLLQIMESDSTPAELKKMAATGYLQYAKRVLSARTQSEKLGRVIPYLPANRKAEVKKYLDELEAEKEKSQ